MTVKFSQLIRCPPPPFPFLFFSLHLDSDLPPLLYLSPLYFHLYFLFLTLPLGCGRLAAINNVHCISHNPETLRAGFRMPISSSPPSPFRTIQGTAGGSKTKIAQRTQSAHNAQNDQNTQNTPNNMQNGTLSRPMSAILQSKSMEFHGDLFVNAESDLCSDSYATHSVTRPKTSSKNFLALFIISYYLFIICSIIYPVFAFISFNVSINSVVRVL